MADNKVGSISLSQWKGLIKDFESTLPTVLPEGGFKAFFTHVLDELNKPFAKKFDELSFENKYFFTPVNKNTFTQESLAEKIFSYIVPLVNIFFPFIQAGLLAVGYLALAVKHLVQAIMVAVESKDKTALSQNVDAKTHLQEAASHFMMAICMPVVGTVAAWADTTRLVTRVGATIVEAIDSASASSSSSSFSRTK